MKPGSARFVHYSRLGDFNWTWPHFRPEEMADRDSGELVVVPAFMDWLEGLRHVFGKPMVITSGYRTPAHQWEITGRREGAHVDGMAVDVLINGADAFRLEKLAFAMDVMGVGRQQKGPHEKRYVHLDRWTKAPPGLRPRVWSY